MCIGRLTLAASTRSPIPNTFRNTTFHTSTTLTATQRADERRRSAQHGSVRSIGWLGGGLWIDWALRGIRLSMWQRGFKIWADPFVLTFSAADKSVRRCLALSPGTLRCPARHQRFSLNMPRGIKPRRCGAVLDRSSAPRQMLLQHLILRLSLGKDTTNPTIRRIAKRSRKTVQGYGDASAFIFSFNLRPKQCSFLS